MKPFHHFDAPFIFSKCVKSRRSHPNQQDTDTVVRRPRPKYNVAGRSNMGDLNMHVNNIKSRTFINLLRYCQHTKYTIPADVTVTVDKFQLLDSSALPNHVAMMNSVTDNLHIAYLSRGQRKIQRGAEANL